MKKIQLVVLFTLTITMLANLVDAASGDSFYLTRNSVNGSHTLQACARGYHMASLWEIYDVSNNRYNRGFGFIQADSGFGPPAGVFGWVRTGAYPDVAQTGIANCDVWRSDSPSYEGTIIQLPTAWEDLEFGNHIGSWEAGTFSCGNYARVWCVEN